MRGRISGRRTVLGVVMGLALLPGMVACGSDPAPDSATAPGSGAPDPATPAGGTGTITVTADGKRYDFRTDDCSTIEVPAKLFSLSTEDASIELSLPYQPGPFDQDSDRVVVPLTLGGADETYQTVAFTGRRTEDGDRTAGSLSGTARQVITGQQVPFTVEFACPLVRG